MRAIPGRPPKHQATTKQTRARPWRTNPDAHLRVWTIPNILSMVRLAGVPLFLWLVLGPEADVWALGLLMVSGFTDWLDGYLARRLNQMLQARRDPRPGRRPALHPRRRHRPALRDIIPLWVAVLLPAARRCSCGAWSRSCAPAATARCRCTSSARPRPPACSTRSRCSCSATATGASRPLAEVFGWAFAIWGIGLYWWAGVLYAWQVRKLLATGTADAPQPRGQLRMA